MTEHMPLGGANETVKRGQIKLTKSADESGGGGRSAFQRRDRPTGGAISGLLARFHDGYTDSEIAIPENCSRKTEESALSDPCFGVTVGLESQKLISEQGDRNASTRR
jgi:hypothetical protein